MHACGGYEYARGRNPKAIAATAIGLVVAFVGVYAPLVGLDSFSGYAWFLGLAVSFFAYAYLTRAERTPESEAEPATEIAEELS